MMGGYRHSTFAYVAAKTEGGVVLLHGRIRLGIFPHQSVAPPAFETKSVCAGRMALENGYQQGREFVAALLEGTLETCHGKLRLAADDGDRHSAHFVPFHDEGLKSQNRLSVLSISGRRPESYLRQPDLDWELKAAETPYDSLTDLLLEFRLGPHRADATRLEIIADTVAFVHSSSRVKASKASIVLRVAKGLDPNRVTLGYRLLDGHRVVVRGRENGSKFHWHEREGLLHGELTLDASKAPVVHTIANYAEIAQHQCWLSDPSRLPNAHRTAFEAFDDQLALLREAFDNAEGRSYQARDMEAAVAWLLWIHGFQVAHLGGTQKIQVPGPDILAITPHNGDIAIIECTTKHLGSDKKLPDLVANAEKLRRKLDGADQSHRKLLKVLVTTLRADDTAAEREQAARLGVLVVTREDIDDVINRSIAFPNAEKIYAEAFEAARAAQSKYASEPQLSGIMWSEAAR
jgi:hypothetical protein